MSDNPYQPPEADENQNEYRLSLDEDSWKGEMIIYSNVAFTFLFLLAVILIRMLV